MGTLWVDERLAMALTKRQRQMYDFIAEFVESNGYSPSFEEIGAAMGLSSLATVHKHINNLETKQLLRRDYNRSRSIDVLPLPEGIPARGRAITRQLIRTAAGGTHRRRQAH